MSISGLANQAAARRPDFSHFDPVPKGLGEIAAAASIAPSERNENQPSEKSTGQPANAVNTALNVLFGYIPTEILTLYVAVLATLEQPKLSSYAVWTVFICFLVATPIVVWLVYGSKVQAANKPLPLSPKAWPVWEMFAATIAYLAWAFALPNSPFSKFDWYSSGLAGIAVLVASTVLGLLSPFFQRPLNS